MDFRKTLESIVFAGMQRKLPEHVLADLTPQPWYRHYKVWLAISVPCLALVLTWSFVIRRAETAKLAANQGEGRLAAISVPPSVPPKLNVVQLSIDPASRMLVVVVQNVTNGMIALGHVEIELSDRIGQVVGSEIADIRQIPPGGTARFQKPVRQANAASVVVTGISVE